MLKTAIALFKFAAWGLFVACSGMLHVVEVCGQSNSVPAEVETSPSLLRPVWRLPGGRLTMETPAAASGTKATNAVAFMAFPPTNWWAGLVPLFEVERDGDFQLRRRPARGLENATDPFCFILPTEEELESGKIVGRWECTGTRPGGSVSWFVWELASEGEQLSGRFDQGSDFRVAYISGGTFRSNRFSLLVEYGMNQYELTGEWREGKMRGRWELQGDDDEGERGSWEAKRAETIRPRLPSDNKRVAPLYEYRRGPLRGGERWYEVGQGQGPPGPGWERTQRPLGRVWPAP